MKQIPLHNSDKVWLVSDEDYDYLSRLEWIINSRGYPTLRNAQAHSIILLTPDGFQVDHIDGNPLNNVRSNLRICTKSQNMYNRKIPKNNTTGYKGVSWKKQNKKYRVIIQVNKKPIHLGYFENIVDAAMAYDAAARKYHGEFAKTNF